MISRFKIFQEISGNYLSNSIPDNWKKLTEEKQNKFIEQNTWQPLEHYEIDSILTMIDISTNNIVELLKKHNIKVIEN